MPIIDSIAGCTIGRYSIQAHPNGYWAVRNTTAVASLINGRVMALSNGKTAALGCRLLKALASSDTLEGALLQIGANANGRCALCGRRLTDNESLLRGIGPECWRKTQ